MTGVLPPARTRPAAGWQAGIAALAAMGLLAWITSGRPGVSFVDFVTFADRAHHLGDPSAWMHALYPVGYPLLLAAGRAVLGDVVLAGEVLGVLAGSFLVWTAARSLGLGAALWLLGSGTILAGGVLEGTDLPAAALSVAALLSAAHARDAGHGREALRWSAWAGVLAGAACLVRYTAVPVPILVLVAAPRRGAALAGIAILLVPHLAGAWIAGESPLPDQRGNLGIAWGPHGSPWHPDTLRRWPDGFVRAMGHAAPGVAGGLGLAGLAVGLLLRDRRAALLGGLAVVHSSVLAMLFSNPRLALPAHACVLLGATFLPPGLAAWLARRPGTARYALLAGRGGAFVLGVLGLVLAARAAPALRVPPPEAQAVSLLAQRAGGLSGPFLSNSPWFHVRRDGWVEGAVQIRSVAADPRTFGPEDLARVMDRGRVPYVALEIGRLTRDLPGLSPLVQVRVPGFRRLLRAQGWMVLVREPPVSLIAPDAA
ncbi:MAG: hypothetical protein JXB39_16180 [Deltaproteobacteria bacterium]|nr:hypothetical protein [Deltaproteobacteria bacterium]